MVSAGMGNVPALWKQYSSLVPYCRDHWEPPAACLAPHFLDRLHLRPVNGYYPRNPRQYCLTACCKDHKELPTIPHQIDTDLESSSISLPAVLTPSAFHPLPSTMANHPEAPTFGATIVPTSPDPLRPSQDDILRPPQMLDSPVLTPSTSHEDMAPAYSEKPIIPPHSPFYQHPPASFERVHSRQTSKNHLGVYEKDLESGNGGNSLATPLTMPADDENPFTSKISIDANKECRMWPSRQTLTQQRAAQKTKRRAARGWAGCAPLREWWTTRFTKRQRLWIRIAIALVLVVIIPVGSGRRLVGVGVRGVRWTGGFSSDLKGIRRTGIFSIASDSISGPESPASLSPSTWPLMCERPFGPLRAGGKDPTAPVYIPYLLYQPSLLPTLPSRQEWTTISDTQNSRNRLSLLFTPTRTHPPRHGRCGLRRTRELCIPPTPLTRLYSLHTSHRPQASILSSLSFVGRRYPGLEAFLHSSLFLSFEGVHWDREGDEAEFVYSISGMKWDATGRDKDMGIGMAWVRVWVWTGYGLGNALSASRRESCRALDTGILC
ncbi:hypothetical protein KC327_g3 [Hortaea werneckii]|nr:hypothetical protein KC327_g3 [Hortaea werneckii]